MMVLWPNSRQLFGRVFFELFVARAIKVRVVCSRLLVSEDNRESERATSGLWKPLVPSHRFPAIFPLTERLEQAKVWSSVASKSPPIIRETGDYSTICLSWKARLRGFLLDDNLYKQWIIINFYNFVKILLLTYCLSTSPEAKQFCRLFFGQYLLVLQKCLNQ